MSELIAMNDEEASVRLLVDMMFEKQFKKVEEMIARNPDLSVCMQTRDFYESLQIVLGIRKRIAAFRWQKFFDSCYKRILSSHKKYLTFIIFACLGELQFHENIFEALISVCSLVEFLNDETLQKADVNFCHLNPEIVKVFYYNKLKRIFYRRGGLQKLLKLIGDNKYIAWKFNVNSVSTTAIELDANAELKEEIRVQFIENDISPDEIINNTECKDMAATILSITPFKLPSLPSYEDLIMRLVAFRKKKAPELAKDNRKTDAAKKFEALNAASRECRSSNSIYPDTNYDMKHQENIEQYENIIQAVIRHNRSKCTFNKKAIGRIQEEADGVLEHLKKIIESLTKALSK